MSFRPEILLLALQQWSLCSSYLGCRSLPGLLCVCQHHQAINSFLTLSTQQFHQISQVRAQSPRTALTSDATLKSRLLPVLLIYDYILKVPTTLSSGSISLLEWLTELRETFTYVASLL